MQEVRGDRGSSRRYSKGRGKISLCSFRGVDVFVENKKLLLVNAVKDDNSTLADSDTICLGFDQ